CAACRAECTRAAWPEGSAAAPAFRPTEPPHSCPGSARGGLSCSCPPSLPETPLHSPHDSSRLGNVVPFPVAAIRRAPDPPPAPRRARFTWSVVLWGPLAALAVAGLVVVGSAWWAVRRMTARIERMENVFVAPPAQRPARAAAAGRSVNLLVAGLDGERRTG